MLCRWGRARGVNSMHDFLIKKCKVHTKKSLNMQRKEMQSSTILVFPVVPSRDTGAVSAKRGVAYEFFFSKEWHMSGLPRIDNFFHDNTHLIYIK